LAFTVLHLEQARLVSGGEWGRAERTKERWVEGEMTHTLYAHMNKRNKNK
jgi:hypothetical protein